MQHVGTRDLGTVPKWLHFSLSWLSLASPAWGQCDQWPVTNPECIRVAVCSEAQGHLGRVRFPFSGAGPGASAATQILGICRAFRGRAHVPRCLLLRLLPQSPPPPGLPLSRLGLSRRPQVGWVPIFL